MARRQVTNIKKDNNGNIIVLYNPDAIWSPLGKDMAIMEIESGLNKYFVKLPGIGEVDFVVSKEGAQKILSTDLVNSSNNLSKQNAN